MSINLPMITDMDNSADLLHQLRHTWRIVERAALDQTLDGAAHELRSVHVDILRILGRDGARMSDIARQLGITRQAVNATVRDLIEKDMLELALDPTDRRAKILRYTARGHDGHHAAVQAGRDLETAFANRVGPERAARFVAELAELRSVAVHNLTQPRRLAVSSEHPGDQQA